MANGIDMSKPIGPLPTGAWIAVVAAGVGLVYYTRTHSSTAAAPTVVDNTSGTPGVGVGTDTYTPATAVTPDTTSTAIATNDDWASQAITYLIAQGYEPTMADGAIRNYINGQSLTVQQQALVDVAMKHFGAPPQTLSPPVTNPVAIVPPSTPVSNPVLKPPVSNPVAAPPPATPRKALRYVTVTSWPTQNSTLYGIAKTVYGDGNKWTTIYNANRVGYTRPDGTKGWITNPNVIYAGRTVYVP